MFPIIPLNIHNVIDYIVGAVLLITPAFFGFAEVTIAANVFYTAGLGLILYSLLTQYKYSIAKLIPVRVHMILDALVGLSVMFAPWLLNYRGALTEGQTTVHLALGAGAVALAILTGPRSIHEAQRSHDKDEEEFRRYKSAA